MLFNSVVFIVGFLPLALLTYFLMGKISRRYAMYSLIAFPLIFYGWHIPLNLLLISSSLFVNYLFLIALTRSPRKMILAAGITFNLSILSYFKYTNFLIGNANYLLGLKLQLLDIVLPLAISFFIFQKIAFMVDVYRKQVALPVFPDYCAFILFFPQLIAGPILRHSEFLPQLTDSKKISPNAPNLAIGSTIFIVGLFKKVILADSFAPISDAVYKYSQDGNIPSTPEAWLGMLAFSLQIYFDFSGYSDMAIGLARLFNFKFPMNFNSPYKATSIIDFWRRWHISLSFLLRDYLYISLGGNRKGPIRRYLNLLTTMLIGGLWHGASWTFVIWGGLHGLFLIVNHLLRSLKPPRIESYKSIKRFGTFGCVIFAWVFFRAESFQSAKLFFLGLLGKSGFSREVFTTKIDFLTALTSVFLGLIVCLWLPNVYEWLIKYRPLLSNRHLWETPSKVLQKRWLWRPNLAFFVLTLIILFIAFGNIERAKEFLYFQF